MTTKDYKIPTELQQVLLDFTVQYLVEQPEDLADFAVVYFSRLKARQPAASDGQHSEESMESEDEAGKYRDGVVGCHAICSSGCHCLFATLILQRTTTMPSGAGIEGRACLQRHTIQRKKMTMKLR